MATRIFHKARLGWVLLALSCSAAFSSPLKRSDVVFMYEAPRETYEAYGATVVAWGRTPNEELLAAATNMLFFGSVGMVTEFKRYYDFAPATYEAGLCRDREGKPYKVPWLTDHQYRGIPFWWCCTSQPRFRDFISNRVAQVVLAGADGVHVDDHLGTAGSLWLGGCFCDRCVDGFREYLAGQGLEVLEKAGVNDPAQFNFREQLNQWLSEKPGRKQEQHPLWEQWRVYHLRNAAKYMLELRELAARIGGRRVPLSANAGVLWPQHLADYKALDFLSAEVDHHASRNRISPDPVLAYRLADAVKRPMASTAAGQDWAHIKEQNRPGLVQGWIALAYASGHSLMAPNRQWCYTKEKGTHWYEGPQERFAPLYQFVRTNAQLFEDYENHADVIVALPHAEFDHNTDKVREVASRFNRWNVSFKIALGSDGYVDHPLQKSDLEGDAPVLVLNEAGFLSPDRQVLAGVNANRKHTSVKWVLRHFAPAVKVRSRVPVRIFPRVDRRTGSAVVHVVNWAYDARADGFRTAAQVTLDLRPERLGMKTVKRAMVYRPGLPVMQVKVRRRDKGRVSLKLPEVPLWAVVAVE